MKRYAVLKYLSILLQVLNVPFSVYAGAMLAIGNNQKFVVGLALSMFFVFLQSLIWWMTMEQLDSREIKR